MPELTQMSIYTKICFYQTSKKEYKKVLGDVDYGQEYLDERYGMPYLGRGEGKTIWIQSAIVPLNDQSKISSFYANQR